MQDRFDQHIRMNIQEKKSAEEFPVSDWTRPFKFVGSVWNFRNDGRF